jgi:hypothetical protein
MTGETMLNMLMQRLGNRTDPDLRAALLVEAMQAQSNVLEAMEYIPWFLLSENTSTTTTVNERRLALPPDFLAEDEDGALIYIDANRKENILPKDDFDYCVEYFRDYSPGYPRAYALHGEYFHIFPVPNAAYTVQLRYFARDTVPTDGAVENKWLRNAGMLLLAETGRVGAALYIQNPELAISFTEEYKRQKELLKVRNETQLHTNRDYRKGGVS